jgi:hypothetical protein
MKRRRLAAGLALAGLALLPLAGSLPARAQVEPRSFGVVYDVRLVPTEGVAHVAIRLDDPQREVIALRFRIDPKRHREFQGDGSVTPSAAGDTVEWKPPEVGGTLRYLFRIDHLRNEKSYDSRCARNWAVFRGDDLVPPAHLRTETLSESRASLRLRLPKGWSAVAPYRRGDDGVFSIQHAHRRFDRPTGWIAVGQLGVLRERIADTHVAVAGPRGQRVRRLDLLALMRWTLPVLREIAGGLPERLLVVSGGDPMWRGGLSGPNSVFVHAGLPLISSDGTSPLLHELVHAALGISPGPGGDWIVEGLAESYSLELLVRSKTLSKKRYQKSLAQLAERGRAARKLEVDQADAAVTDRAVGVLHALDREIREGSGGVRSLDDVVRVLFQQGGPVTTERLRRLAEDLSGRDLESFFRRHR